MPTNEPVGDLIIHKESTVSTMDDVRLAAEAGAPDGYGVVAAEQTGGRGRRGKAWFSPPGNLYVSILLRPKAAQTELGQYSFIAALALAQALPDKLAPDIRLKWPNDVLVQGAKIAGLLLETCSTPMGLALIIGMGVNIAHAPPDAPYPVTSLLARGQDADRAALQAILARFVAGLAEYRGIFENQGFAPIRAAWLARASGLQEQMVARLPHEELTGIFMGIDETGCLLLQPPNGRLRVIAAGEVFAPVKKVS